ncbi:hypothetical protein EI94DRAFT_1119786 [Lactarius quietus]|nr:hypothetical protein EI94DRAFT_1119786 [Lactarius quietus]
MVLFRPTSGGHSMSSRKCKLDLLVNVRYQNHCQPHHVHPNSWTSQLEQTPSDTPNLNFSTLSAADFSISRNGRLSGNTAPTTAPPHSSPTNPNNCPESRPTKPTYTRPKRPSSSTRLLGRPTDFGRHSRNHHNHMSGTSLIAAHVAWLRNIEYMSRDKLVLLPLCALHPQPTPHTMRWTYRVTRNSRRSTVRSVLHAQQTMSMHSGTLLNRVWANAYDLFRICERPGERGFEVRFRHTPCTKVAYTSQRITLSTIPSLIPNIFLILPTAFRSSHDRYRRPSRYRVL